MKVIPKEEAIAIVKREIGKRRKEKEDRKKAMGYELANYTRSRIWQLRR